MSKISRDSAAALVENRNYYNGNTLVKDGQMRLHGNLIAVYDSGHICIDSCGWNTVTTRARLNAIGHILGFSVSVSRGVLWLYVHGKVLKWNGLPITLTVKNEVKK